MTWQSRLLIVFVMLHITELQAAEPLLPRVPFEPANAKSFQQDWAAAAGTPLEFTNSIGVKLVLIPPGHFSMGPNGSTYRVTISKPFYIGATEVTLGQYRRFAAEHRVEGAADEFNADDRPAAMVSWDEAQAFCKWLSGQPDER